MTNFEGTVASMTERLNQQLFRDLTIFSSSDLIIYNHPGQFYQQYRLASWYLPELLNTLVSRHLSIKAVLVALESEHFQLLRINAEAQLNEKYGVPTRLFQLMVRYYRRRYAEWSAHHEDEIVERKWHNENVRYYDNLAYRHKADQKISNFKNPKLPF